jgi:hypothetical protein
MDIIKKLLFYYSIILTTVLIIGTIFFMPEPRNFVLSASLIPITLFLWLITTSPGRVSAANWSLRLLLIVGLFSALGLYSYSFTRTPVETPEDIAKKDQAIDDIKVAIDKLRDNPTDDAMLNTLESIREELDDIKSEQTSIKSVIGTTSRINSTLGESDTYSSPLDTSGAIGKVTPRSSITIAKVYADADNASSTVGTLSYGKSYSFYKSQGSWYQIFLEDDEILGWVKATDVSEITNDLP